MTDPDDPDPGPDGDPGPDPAAGDAPAVDLLAVAARELIGAARRVLDAVETVVDDPGPATGTAAAVMSDIVRQATRAGASLFAPHRPTPPPGEYDVDGADDDEDGPGGGVQFIRVD